MIPAEELEAWAKLYDLGHQNFDPLSDDAKNARVELDLRLKEAYQRLVPGGSISFRDFKSRAKRNIFALLKSRRPPSP